MKYAEMNTFLPYISYTTNNHLEFPREIAAVFVIEFLLHQEVQSSMTTLSTPYSVYGIRLSSLDLSIKQSNNIKHIFVIIIARPFD